MKCAGTPLAEYTGLRPKLYSGLWADEQIVKKEKRVKKYVINKLIHTHNEHATLSSLQHKWTNNKQNNTLTALHKRYIAPDGITTYAYGCSQYHQEQWAVPL